MAGTGRKEHFTPTEEWRRLYAESAGPPSEPTTVTVNGGKHPHAQSAVSIQSLLILGQLSHLEGKAPSPGAGTLWPSGRARGGGRWNGSHWVQGKAVAQDEASSCRRPQPRELQGFWRYLWWNVANGQGVSCGHFLSPSLEGRQKRERGLVGSSPRKHEWGVSAKTGGRGPAFIKSLLGARHYRALAYLIFVTLQILTERLLCAKHCFRHWGYSGKQKLCSSWTNKQICDIISVINTYHQY